MAAARDRFVNRTVLITGAASGIGAACARLFAAEGATVCCADIDPVGADRTARELAGSARDALPLHLDVTDEAQWISTMQRIVERFTHLDVLVSSAGVSFAAPVTATPLSDWRRLFAVNVDGVFLGMKHALPAMSAGGSIINVSSASGLRPSAGASAYSATKAAVGMLTRATAKECRERGRLVRINAVAPGGVKTPMWMTMPFFRDLVVQHGSQEAAFSALAAMDGAARFAEPEEIAHAILFLASDDAAMITGVELPVDGGFVL